MADAYIGQIQTFGFGFAPKGWAICAGQTLPINQYQALFSLLGTTYGGNGINTFQLPDLRSRIAVGQGRNAQGTTVILGETGGEENHTLLLSETPLHTHSLNATAVAASTATVGPTAALAQPASGVFLYVADNAPAQTLAPTALSNAGANLPHSNLMPYTAVNICIALTGIFPSRN